MPKVLCRVAKTISTVAARYCAPSRVAVGVVIAVRVGFKIVAVVVDKLASGIEDDATVKAECGFGPSVLSHADAVRRC